MFVLSNGSSWLNIAENERSSLARQCVAGRRIGSAAEIPQETTAGHDDVDQNQPGVELQMKIDNARSKLASVYRNIKTQQSTILSLRLI